MKEVACSKRRSRFLAILSVLVLCLFAGAEAFGQEPQKTGEVSGSAVGEAGGLAAKTPGDVFTLGVVEVAGEKEKIRTPVERVDYQEMREFNANRLPDALNLVPGVTVTNTGNRNDANVYVRGFGPTRVPVFLDGVPIYVPYDRTFDFNRFTTFDLSEILVSKGFTSVLYGPNTMGGAINLVTKRPVKPFEGDASVGIASGNTYYGYSNVGTNQKKWYLQAGASYFNQDSYPMSDNFTPTTVQGGGNRINSYSKDDKVNFKVGFTPAEGHEYAFTYINQHGEKGQPPDMRPSTLGGGTNFWQWPKWDKESYYLSTQTPIGEKSYVKSRLYYDQFDNWLDYFTNDAYTTLRRDASFGERSYYNDYTLGGSIEGGTTLIPYNTLKASFHYKRDSHSETNRVYNIGTTAKPVNVSPPWAHDDNATTSVGLEDTIDITKSFYAVAGASYDALSGLRANKYVYNGSNPTPILHDFDTNYESSWNPQLGLFYRLTDTAKIHLTAEEKTRFPTMKEKYSWGLPGRNGQTIENPDLKPERAKNYELGYDDVFFKRIRFKAALFHNDISDAIQSVTFIQAGTTYNQNQNIQSVKQYGAELQGIVSVTKDLEGGVNYMYLDRQNDSSNQAIAGYKLTDVPRNKIFTYLKYQTPVRGLSMLGSLEYNSSRYSSTTPSAYGYIAGSFAIANISATYQVRPGLTVRAGINNLLDRNYQYVVGYPNPGRTYFANLTYSF